MNTKVQAVFDKYAKEIGLYKFHRDTTTLKVTIRTEYRVSWQFKHDMLRALSSHVDAKFLLLTLNQISQLKGPPEATKEGTI